MNRDERINNVKEQFRQLVSDLRDLQSTSAEVDGRSMSIAVTHTQTAELWFKAAIVEADQSSEG